MVTLIGKEWGGTGSGVGCIIICKFCERLEVRPVILLIVVVDSEVLFQGLVGVFGLSVTFRVISRGEMKLHVKGFPEGPEKG